MGARPILITVIAIVLAISGIAQIVVGTEALGLTKFGLAAGAAGINGWASVLSGVLTIVVSAGLFTLASWAWVLTVVVMAIRIIADVLAVIASGANSTVGGASIANLVISGLILIYFMRPSVKAAFGR